MARSFASWIMGRAVKIFERSGERISKRITHKFGYKYPLSRTSRANWKTRVHPREQALHLESSRLDLLQSASNMVLILATSKSRQTVRSFEIRDGNNEFPVNLYLGRATMASLSYTGCIKMRSCAGLASQPTLRRILFRWCSRQEYLCSLYGYI